jgi:hypothetical protein
MSYVVFAKQHRGIYSAGTGWESNTLFLPNNIHQRIQMLREIKKPPPFLMRVS